MSESKFYHFTATGLFYGVATPGEAISASNEGGFIWLNYYKPSREEFHHLLRHSGFIRYQLKTVLMINRFRKLSISAIIPLFFSMHSAMLKRALH